MMDCDQVLVGERPVPIGPSESRCSQHGRLVARNLLVCDHIPNHTKFVGADRRLRRLGRRRCLFISRLRPGQRESFQLTLRVNANAAPSSS